MDVLKNIKNDNDFTINTCIILIVFTVRFLKYLSVLQILIVKIL